jgi:hypothetical protein
MSTSRTPKGAKTKPVKKPRPPKAKLAKKPVAKIKPAKKPQPRKVVLAKRPVAKSQPAKPTMSLHFTNRRFVPALDYTDPVACKGPWLDAKLVSGGIRKQLVMIVGGSIGGKRSEAELFSGGYDTFSGFCEVPLEWWDVVDDEGKARYQLWLFGSDSGVLFVHNTTEMVGYVVQCGFESDGIDIEIEEELARAYKRCRKKYPKTYLGRCWVRLG